MTEEQDNCQEAGQEASDERNPHDLPAYIEANKLRKLIKEVGANAKNLRNQFFYTEDIEDLRVDSGDISQDHELVKNLDLAYAYLEDASMRLGKFMQAMDGGVSVYDKETTVGA